MSNKTLFTRQNQKQSNQQEPVEVERQLRLKVKEKERERKTGYQKATITGSKVLHLLQRTKSRLKRRHLSGVFHFIKENSLLRKQRPTKTRLNRMMNFEIRSLVGLKILLDTPRASSISAW